MRRSSALCRVYRLRHPRLEEMIAKEEAEAHPPYKDIRAIMEKKVYRGYIGIMEKNMETTIVYRDIQGLYRENGKENGN